MFWFYVISSSTLVFNGCNTLFVSVGDYRPDLGVNHPYCGRSFVPKFRDFFMYRCFENLYPNKTSYDEMWSQWDPHSHRLERDAQSRVVQGKFAKPGEAPWSVVLFTGGKLANIDLRLWLDGATDFPYCSGSLVTLEWVLTAAHCINKLKYIYVYAGSNHRDPAFEGVFQGIERWSSKQFAHPNYSYPDRTAYDFGLVKLNKPYQRTTESMRYTINPVCLPTLSRRFNKESEKAFLYGFGLDNGTQATRWLKEYRPAAFQMGRADIELLPHVLCVDNLMLCTEFKEDSPRPCPGDSGGGLVQRVPGREAAVVVGLVSWAIGSPEGLAQCLPPLMPDRSFFSYVPRVMPWILETIINN